MQFSRPLLLPRQNPGQWRGLGGLPFEHFFILTDTDVEALHGAGQSKEAAGQSRQSRCASKQPTESDGTEIASPPNGLVGRGQTTAPIKWLSRISTPLYLQRLCKISFILSRN